MVNELLNVLKEELDAINEALSTQKSVCEAYEKLSLMHHPKLTP